MAHHFAHAVWGQLERLGRHTHVGAVCAEPAEKDLGLADIQGIKQSGHYYPAFKWEALLVFQKPGDMPRMTPEGMSYMATYHSNVWEIANVINTLKHPAACPVEIPFRCLQAYTCARE